MSPRASRRQRGRQRGRQTGSSKNRCKKFVQNVRELDQSDDWIMSKLIKDYGATFSKSELKKLMLEAEQEYFFT